MEHEKCNACDPSSSVLHSVQVSRIRVANLCCSGEEKIIRSCLGELTGVEHIAVNIVGRYAVVKHCPVACCAPIDDILKALNDKYLGATIQEVAHGADQQEESQWEVYGIQMVHVIVVFILFVLGLVLHFFEHLELAAMWLFIGSVILGIGPMLYAAGIAIFIRHSLDIHVLMTIAIVGALASAEYFDASLVVTLFLGAELAEQIIMFRVRKAVQMSSAGTMPSSAFLLDGTSVPVDKIQIDQVLAVRTGEMVLADGIIVKGECVLDESALTGESIPIQKLAGQIVKSGTVVQNGYIELKVTSSSAESTMQRLKQEVMDVQADRGQYATLVDSFSNYWTPAVLIAAAIYVVIDGSVAKDWNTSVYRGLLILVLACPCAIVISAPIPAVCAIATAAKNGVLIRGSTVVEHMGGIDTIALDKTGTLTKGFFKVIKKAYLTEDDKEGAQCLAYAAAIEEKSTHPVASAVVSEAMGCVAEASGEALLPVRKVTVLEGVGLSGWVETEPNEWKFVAVGNERLLSSHGGEVSLSPANEQALSTFLADPLAQNSVILYVAVEDELKLILALADEIRPESRNFVTKMQRDMHMFVNMLTGDTESVARSVCEYVGIPATQCHYRLLPHQKLQWIKQMQHMHNGKEPDSNVKHLTLIESDIETGTVALEMSVATKKTVTPASFATLPTSSIKRSVLMVGDGINDSTALAAADVGIAMGAGGTAMAVTAADVVLMNDNLLMIPAAVRLCVVARAVMIENCVFSIGIKIVAIVLAVMGYLTFWHAILIDLGSLVVVVVNGTRILYYHNLFRAGAISTVIGVTEKKTAKNPLSFTSSSSSAPLSPSSLVEEEKAERGEVVSPQSTTSSSTSLSAPPVAVATSSLPSVTATPVVLSVTAASVSCKDHHAHAHGHGHLFDPAHVGVHKKSPPAVVSRKIPTEEDDTCEKKGCCSSTSESTSNASKKETVGSVVKEGDCKKGCCGSSEENKVTLSTTTATVLKTKASLCCTHKECHSEECLSSSSSPCHCKCLHTSPGDDTGATTTTSVSVKQGGGGAGRVVPTEDDACKKGCCATSPLVPNERGKVSGRTVPKGDDECTSGCCSTTTAEKAASAKRVAPTEDDSCEKKGCCSSTAVEKGKPSSNDSDCSGGGGGSSSCCSSAGPHGGHDKCHAAPPSSLTPWSPQNASFPSATASPSTTSTTLPSVSGGDAVAGKPVTVKKDFFVIKPKK